MPKSIVEKILKLAAILFLLMQVSCVVEKESSLDDFQIAFLADVHLQDIYGTFTDSVICTHPKNGKSLTIRTMQSQLNSTRLFNENYFAFLAALDDVASRGVKYVALPGDFTDNGQPMNALGVKRILNEYTQKYNIEFFMITGNHDPTKPYSSEGGRHDFLSQNGQSQPVFSKVGLYESNSKNELPVIISSDVMQLGYEGIVNIFQNNGFFPNQNYLYWETPFSKYNSEDYTFDQAKEEADLKRRVYTIQPNSMIVPDVSYLVEPIDGLWLLAIDGNVYIPKNEVSNLNENASNYNGSSIGYNSVIEHKKHIVDWVKSVGQRAEKNGKTLVAFSHYPIVEYYDGASAEIIRLFGENSMQLHRNPSEEIAEIFSEAGIKIHFAGHMHSNDTGINRGVNGTSIVNVQVPCMASYLPGYKLLTIREKHLMEVETIVIDSIPRFNELFDLYQIEHDYLESIQAENIWEENVLSAKNYREFVNWHLKELIRLKNFKKDWPKDLYNYLSSATGKDILILSQIDDPDLISLYFKEPDHNFSLNEDVRDQAIIKATQLALKNNLNIEEFEAWDGKDLVIDFYRLKNADALAFEDIGINRLKQYELLNEAFRLRLESIDNKTEDLQGIIRMADLFSIMHKFSNGAPAIHFMLDLEKGEIKDLSGETAE